LAELRFRGSVKSVGPLVREVRGTVRSVGSEYKVRVCRNRNIANLKTIDHYDNIQRGSLLFLRQS